MDAENDDDQNLVKETIGVGMPYRYRTPDLVDYLNNNARPTCKSDVYQLGLVIAELFTGRNPQRPSQVFTEAIDRERLGDIPGAMAPGIRNLIEEMLEVEPDLRRTAGFFLDPWQGVFIDAAKRTHALEGKVF